MDSEPQLGRAARSLHGVRLGAPERTAAGFAVAVEVDDDCPLFAGHFPGMPMLPGVAQLLIVELAWQAATGRRARLRSVTRARFRAAVAPGDRLRLELRGGAERLTFGLSRDRDRIAEGIVTLHEELST